MPDATQPLTDRRPLLVMAVGRQRVGKTSILNAIIEYVRTNDGELVVWNADTMNTTHSLSNFYPDVLEPGSGDMEDVKIWIEERIADLVKHRYDAILDVGGGNTALSRLVEEVPIVRSLERFGVRVVLMHVVGPDRADLDYLERFLAKGLFAPKATVVVLNDGLILTGRSSTSAFENVRSHPALLSAVHKGANVAFFPRLSCMSRIADAQISFHTAMGDQNDSGQSELSFFDQERVAVWWDKDLPKFFASIPSHWLPAMPAIPPFASTALVEQAEAP